MKIVNPNSATHFIVVIPRQYDYVDLVLELYNEETQVKAVVPNTHELIDGYLFIDFNFVFIEGQKFQIKVTEQSEVIYRGKLIATVQDPQNYKASKDLYYYD